MATEKTENPGERPMSMKERLQAQRRAEAEAGAAPAPSAPPVPAAKPVARPAAARPAPSAAPAPAAPAAAAAPARPATTSRASAARPAPAAGKPAAPRRDAKTMSADVQREVEMLRKRQDKWLMYGWIVAGAMILIAGGAYLYSQHKVSERENAKLTYEKTMKDLQAEITGMAGSINSIDAAKKLIARAEETKVTVRMPDGHQDEGWKGTYVADVTSKINSAVGKATSWIKTEETRNELINGLASLEASIRDADSKKPEELAQLRRRLVEYETGGDKIGPEFETRVASARINLNRAVAKRLFDEARAVAAKGEARAALAAYGKAEEELRSLMDEAHSRHNADAIAWVEPLYQQCIEESDKISYAAFTPEVIEKTAWVDILATPEIKWGNDGLKGFRNDNGQVQAIGSEIGSKREGIFSVGDLEKWRDFVMEIEFVPVRGSTNLYWRLGKQTSAAPDEFRVDAAGDDGFKPNQTCSMTVTYIGSRRLFEFSPNLERDPEPLDPIGWRRERVGAFGAKLAEGAEFKITKLRIKVLRSGKTR